MRDRDTGSLIVFDGARPVGILTERDILAKVVAERRDPETATVGDIMTQDLITLGPDGTVEDALRLMRRHRIRHLPIISEGRFEGLVTERAVAAVAPELMAIAGDWNQITANGNGAGIRDILSEEETTGPCEGCDNQEVALRDIDGKLLCEDCAESVEGRPVEETTL